MILLIEQLFPPQSELRSEQLRGNENGQARDLAIGTERKDHDLAHGKK